MEEQTKGCVLFADVSGSTKLYESVGDSAAHAAIDLCVKLFRALTEQHGGRVIQTTRDGGLALFPDAAAAGQGPGAPPRRGPDKDPPRRTARRRARTPPAAARAPPRRVRV